MALGKKKSKKKEKSKKGGDKKKAVWRNILSVWNSDKFDGQTVNVDKRARGHLLYQDPETEQFYVIKSMSLFEAKDGDPDNLVANLVLNLKNEYHVEKAGSDDEDEDED